MGAHSIEKLVIAYFWRIIRYLPRLEIAFSIIFAEFLGAGRKGCELYFDLIAGSGNHLLFRNQN